MIFVHEMKRKDAKLAGGGFLPHATVVSRLCARKGNQT